MNISDEKLYALCRQYGEAALKWRWKFAGLLPEVFKRGLYKKKGFSSIFEFAAKLAGMSEEQVRRVLNLEKRFEKTPQLKELLVTGAVSVNKLVRVASVADSDSDGFWAQQAITLPVRALATLVKDERSVHVNTETPFSKEKSINTESLDLSQEVLERLSKLKEKGIDINEMLLGFLRKRDEEIAHEKIQLAEQTEEMTRHVPMKIKNLINKEYGTKCAVPTCAQLADELHHTNRFSISKNHNPFFMAPLCKSHHIIAHSVDMEFNEKRRNFAARGP